MNARGEVGMAKALVGTRATVVEATPGTCIGASDDT